MARMSGSGPSTGHRGGKDGEGPASGGQGHRRQAAGRALRPAVERDRGHGGPLHTGRVLRRQQYELLANPTPRLPENKETNFTKR